ncbi:MAG: MFS transporter [Novosphingobium sp.]
MATTALGSSVRRSPVFVIVVLLTLAIFINALDRGNFSTAAPLIKGDLNLSNSQIGILISAFFWTYVPGHALSGWLIEQTDAYRTLAWALALWALATFLTGFASGFAALLALRLLLGLGESAAFPCASKLLAQLVPQHRLASANAWTGVGLMMGNALGIFVGGMLIARLGWHALFFVFGALSLLWLVPWLRAKRPSPINLGLADELGLAEELGRAPRYAEMLRNRDMWGAMLGHMCGNYSYFLVLSWLPLYLVKQQGFAITTMAMLGGLVYVFASLSAVIGARLTDALVARGGNVSFIRKAVIFFSGCVGVSCMLACATGNTALTVAGLLGYGACTGTAYFSFYSIGQTLAGPRAAGKWVALQNGCGGMAGAISPLVTGFTIDATGDYRVAFLIAAGIAVIGMICWGLVVGTVAPIRWSTSAEIRP